MIKILNYSEVAKESIFSRTAKTSDVSGIVAEIIADVRKNGDKALFSYCEKFDGAKLSSLKVSKAEMESAEKFADKEFINILKHAAKNITEFHSRQKREGFEFVNQDGATVGQKIIPLKRVGIYVPGGTATYPSTVLMDTIPAKIAGVERVVMVTPSKNGKIAPEILVAAKIAGIDEIYKVGGAQAVAALAYGTESIPKVDKIVGPGNAYVAEAKKQVFGDVSIDMIAGPSEIMIISDGESDPVSVAADLLSQAEHDRLASAVLITDDAEFAEKVAIETERQIPTLKRSEIARGSIDSNGKIIVVEDLRVAVQLANEIAPEHLELCVDDPFSMFKNIENAGSVFLGRNTPEALGDYIAGPNHTLPTGGTARFSSPLSVDDFVKKTQFIYYPEEALLKVKKDVATFAEREGLTAHAGSVLKRQGEI